MRRLILLATLPLLVLAACGGPEGPPPEVLARWEARAAHVSITRDDWGIPHVRGTTDADAVFGMIYAQAEDDFNRIEVNYLNALGRLAEAEGEAALWRDLRMRLFIDADTLKAQYAASPAWLRGLMDAWADGLNYYLHVHPEVRPRVLTAFEPWMALAFSEGSIGGDIESVDLAGLERFYGGAAPAAARGPAPLRATPLTLADARPRLSEPSGSNGFAIGPARSASGKALLLINPHTSFFFREELQMTSGDGLDAYGAVTWGQFFVYQGFNDRIGWMHTSSGNDAIDEYAVAVARAGDGWTYRHGDSTRRVVTRELALRYRSGDTLATRRVTVHRTHHGPVVRGLDDGRWVAVRLMQEPVKALTQSYTRTKARSLDEFKATMALHTNSSNNTVYADADGNIAYFHANFVPRRDPRFDWERPVDGNDPATDWQGIHSLEESPNVFNPPTGWIQNTNNWPYSAAGRFSPRAADYPAYMDRSGENPRGVHAMEVLARETAFDLDKLVAAAYDPHLTAFDALVPALVRDHAALRAADPRRAALAEPVALLRDWDRRSGTESAATTLAILWGEELWTRLRAHPEAEGSDLMAFLASAGRGEDRLAALAATLERLQRDFGSWRVRWGEINRFQRLTGDIVQPFSDSGPSLPVGFASSRWGSLAAFGARTYPGTKRMYGTSGNSFVAVVEFGDTVRARAVTAGGLNSVPSHPHFNDQAERYAKGELRPVYFTRAQLEGHIERTYRPGERAPAP